MAESTKLKIKPQGKPAPASSWQKAESPTLRNLP